MKLYSDFHKAILENDAAKITPAFKAHSRLTGIQQFAIYSEGYRIRLKQAIRSDYPILLKLLGDSAFDALAGAYIEQIPPTSYNLDFYPHKFAVFVGERLNEVFASELATLEATIAEVFMLPDSEPFSLDKFSKIVPENFGNMVFNLRAACRLLQFSYPVSEWLSDARVQEILPEIPLLNFVIPDTSFFQERSDWQEKLSGVVSSRNESLDASLRWHDKKDSNFLLVVRHNNEVQRHSLSEQEFVLLTNLVNGKNVAEALEKTLDEQPSYAENIINNLQRWFIGWIKNGVFIDV